MTKQSIAFAVAETPIARSAAQRLAELYPPVPENEAEIIIALGGDGLVLETLHRYLARRIPVYGMNCGAIGFLTNKFDETNLLSRLAHARPAKLHPLSMRAFSDDNPIVEAHAINEVALTRSHRQAGKIRIIVDDHIRMQELIADGILLATALGSTAYNLSAHGPILPLSSEMLALTPISAFRPRRWRGALLPRTVQLCLEVLEADKRPMAAVADYTEARNVNRVEIVEDRQVTFTLLFDPGEDLNERILKEQFVI